MEIIDLDRWQALRAAYADAVDTAPSFARLQDAHRRASQARTELETFEARGAVGQRSQRHPDVVKSFEAGRVELTQRVLAADAEVQRISGLQQKASSRINALRTLLDAVQAWAHQQSPPITLPGDDEISMGGFSSSSVQIATSPGREPFGISSARG